MTCKRCSFVYLANPPDESSLYEEYHSRAQATVDGYRIDSPDRRLAELCAINEQRIEMIRQVQPDGRLLDLGCGRGFFMKTAAESGFQVSGVDVSKEAATFARTTLGLAASTDTLDQLVARRERFTVITAWHVLEHFMNPVATLQAIRSLLVDGGFCFVEVPNLNSLKFILARAKWEGGNHPLYHRSFFTRSTLGQVFRRAGFSDVRRVPLSYRIPGRARIYESGKQLLNILALDAFLDFQARK